METGNWIVLSANSQRVTELLEVMLVEAGVWAHTMAWYGENAIPYRPNGGGAETRRRGEAKDLAV